MAYLIASDICNLLQSQIDTDGLLEYFCRECNFFHDN